MQNVSLYKPVLLFNMALTVVIAVDVSGSTWSVPNYYSRVNNLIVKGSKLILWGSGASFSLHSKLSKYSNYGHERDTKLADCLTLLSTIPEEKYNFVIVTDGIVTDVLESRAVMKRCNLDTKIARVDIHFIGDKDSMNMEINTIFDGIHQSIYVNESPSAQIHAKFDWERVDLDDFLKDFNTAKATLIAKMHGLSEKDKKLLISKFRNYEKDKLRRMAYAKSATLKENISTLYDRRDVAGFVKLVKTDAYVGVDDKKKLQQIVQQCVNLLQNRRDLYSLDHIEKLDTDLTDLHIEDDELSELECDILYEKCQNACMLVTAPTEPLITENFKKYADNPFLLLENEDVLKKLVKCVEHYTIDFNTYQQLQDKLKSPFTRQTLKSVFILQCNADIHHLMSHNARAISILFGPDNKLPGSLCLWVVIFIYIMAKRHPVYSQHPDFLFSLIRKLAAQASTIITFNKAIHPNIMTKLNIALWYAVEVSPLAFPNSEKNLLRKYKKQFYTFYSEVFEKPTLDASCLYSFEIWEYLVHNQTDSYLKAKVLAQIQHHKVIRDKIVFFEGECKTRYECPLKNFEVNDVLNLYTLLETCKNTASLYENISGAKTHDFKVKPVLEGEELQLEHVQINLKTCQPFVICPITKLHWKRCAKSFDKSSESYYRMFRRYCHHNREYPKNTDDLLLFASERYFRATNQFKIYNEIQVYTVLEDVLKKFTRVMQTVTCELYLKTVELFQLETDRLKYE